MWNNSIYRISFYPPYNELMKEYRKEFFSEGQLFYFYKRHNYKTFPYCVKEDMSASYQWPLPDNEKTFGNNN